MDQDLLIQAAKILGEWGVAVDVEEIKARQAEPRYPNQQPTAAATGARF
jgi:hypothetical protein